MYSNRKSKTISTPEMHSKFLTMKNWRVISSHILTKICSNLLKDLIIYDKKLLRYSDFFCPISDTVSKDIIHSLTHALVLGRLTSHRKRLGKCVEI